MRPSDSPGIISQHNRRGMRNPWVLGMLGLIFAVLAVNATFIWLSTQSNRSTLVDREYKSRDRKTGAEFLNEMGSRQALGWQVTVKRPPAAILDEPVMYEITVKDRDGKPVSGEMIVEAYRAADAKRDFDTRFKEVTVGSYQGFITFPLKGYWELNVRITRGDEIFSAHANRFTVAERH
jgi:hypothetical protein